MLGHTFRIRANNTQNQAITVTVKGRYWKFDASGNLTYSTEQVLINAASVAATTGTAVSTNVDNSTSAWLGAELTLSCTAGAATNGSGTLAVFVERSTDAGTTWPTTTLGEWVGGYTVTAGDGTAARLANIRVE